MSPDKHRRIPRTATAGPRPVAIPVPTDHGPPYEVRWPPAASGELDASWPASEKAAMHNAVEKLIASGPRLPFPHASAVKGHIGQGFRELRPRSGRSRWRPIYRRVLPGTFVVFAVAPESQIDRKGFDAAIGRAAARFSTLDLD